MDYLDLPAANRAEGTIRLPGSKSITIRALLLAALAAGETRLEGVLESDDTRVMLDALRVLGVSWRPAGPGIFVVDGAAGPFRVKQAELFAGISGVSARSLVATLALSGGHYGIDGGARMRERPIRDLVDALRLVGADIVYAGADGFFPLRIAPGSIRVRGPIRVRGDVSSQFLTGLLQALPLCGQPAVVEVEGKLISAPYIEITLNMMERFGVVVQRQDWTGFRIPGGQRYRSPGTLPVEGDASGASYFLAAGAISGSRGHGRARVEGVGSGSIQGDVRFADALEQMGASVTRGDRWLEAGASGALRGVDLDCVAIPDAAMTLAIVALFADGPTTLRGIGSWRVKETDRIAAMASELRKVGAVVDEGPDWLRIAPPAQVRGATIDTYDDHRMAMCFSLVTLGGVPMRINDPNCVRKTYPDYFADFRSIVA
jgi:3-phosphoshikimate 1-carboxyvinyltransferase